MYRLLSNNRGFVNIFVAILIVVLLGFAALAIDVGMLTYEKSQLQKACDAAALAGAQELPDDIDAAENKAVKYADKNGLLETEITSIDITEDNRKITVNAERTIPYSFARVLGLGQGILTAHASASNIPANRMGGLRPFGVVSDAFALNEEVTLEFGSQDSNSGNFGSLAFDGSGGTVYETTIENGSTSTWQVGDTVPSQPGNMVGPTWQGIRDLIDGCTHVPECTAESYQMDCPRVITVPLIDAYGNGRTTVTIVGFARFFLNSYTHSGNVTVTGQFIEEVVPGSSDPEDPDFGVRTVKLTE